MVEISGTTPGSWNLVLGLIVTGNCRAIIMHPLCALTNIVTVVPTFLTQEFLCRQQNRDQQLLYVRLAITSGLAIGGG